MSILINEEKTLQILNINFSDYNMKYRSCDGATARYFFKAPFRFRAAFDRHVESLDGLYIYIGFNTGDNLFHLRIVDGDSRREIFETSNATLSFLTHELGEWLTTFSQKHTPELELI
jgi:hypothetical protein